MHFIDVPKITNESLLFVYTITYVFVISYTLWGRPRIFRRREHSKCCNSLKVVLSHATHFFFDQPQEPDPEETGLYWATRFTDAKKTFYFLPDRLYDNIAVKRSGERITKAEVCGNKNENCPPLQNKDNIIGKIHSFNENIELK